MYGWTQGVTDMLNYLARRVPQIVPTLLFASMFAFIMLAALLLFGGPIRRAALWIGLGTLIAVAIVLGETRGIWIAVAVAILYLCWFWRKWLVIAAPVVVLVGIAISPAAIRDRFTSIFKPKGVDSNQFRVVTWRTGIEMIKQHPWLGLGRDSRPGGFHCLSRPT